MKVEPGGTGVVAHVGLHAVGAFADRLGLGNALSEALVWRDPGVPVHDRGKVLVQSALMLAGGGESCLDIEHLRVGPDLFGSVPSDTSAQSSNRPRISASSQSKSPWTGFPPGVASSSGSPASWSRCHRQARRRSNSSTEHTLDAVQPASTPKAIRSNNAVLSAPVTRLGTGPFSRRVAPAHCCAGAPQNRTCPLSRHPAQAGF
ncbi:MAG: hypothetical protein GY926_12395 [bacterium]|nr:hypothetical protein [bacterium]